VVPLFMFFVRDKKVAATALCDCSIRLRDGARTAWQSCFVQQPRIVESEQREQGLGEVGILDARPNMTSW
jgi:hypothetical protein